MEKALSPKQYREMMAAKSRPSNSKFRNTWTEVDGINFQSKTEADYYGRLKLRKRGGYIKDFQRGVLFTLVVNKVIICTYRADFVIEHQDGSRSVIDVKGDATENVYSFKIKKKLMKALFNIEIQIVKK